MIVTPDGLLRIPRKLPLLAAGPPPPEPPSAVPVGRHEPIQWREPPGAVPPPPAQQQQRQGVNASAAAAGTRQGQAWGSGPTRRGGLPIPPGGRRAGAPPAIAAAAVGEKRPRPDPTCSPGYDPAWDLGVERRQRHKGRGCAARHNARRQLPKKVPHGNSPLECQVREAWIAVEGAKGRAPRSWMVWLAATRRSSSNRGQCLALAANRRRRSRRRAVAGATHSLGRQHGSLASSSSR